jgi:hypothetical protein
MGDSLIPLPLTGVSGSTQAAQTLNAMWRPPQWTQGVGATLTITAVQPTSGQTPPNPATIPATAGNATAQQTTVMYVVDGTIRADHQQEMVITTNPVQTGAPLSDHTYLMPARLTVDVAMSDAMQSYVVGQFSGSGSRSVAAYQVLLGLQVSRAVLQVSTRLMQYSNMMIVDLAPEETVETRFGLRCRVTFQQIITANVQTDTYTQFDPSRYTLYNPQFPSVTPLSARPQTTDLSQYGSTMTQPVSGAITQQHSADLIPSSAALAQAQQVDGGGDWSSTNIAQFSASRFSLTPLS